MTDAEIAETIAKLLYEDRVLKTHFQSLYQKDVTVFCEYNRRKWPKENDAPFIYVNVDGSAEDLTENYTESQIGLLAGILEKEEIKTDYGTKLKALSVLSDTIFPRIAELLRSVPQFYAEKLEQDFIFENFPLCMLSITATIKQNTPIGMTRR